MQKSELKEGEEYCYNSMANSAVLPVTVISISEDGTTALVGFTRELKAWKKDPTICIPGTLSIPVDRLYRSLD